MTNDSQSHMSGEGTEESGRNISLVTPEKPEYGDLSQEGDPRTDFLDTSLHTVASDLSIELSLLFDSEVDVSAKHDLSLRASQLANSDLEATTSNVTHVIPDDSPKMISDDLVIQTSPSHDLETLVSVSQELLHIDEDKTTTVSDVVGEPQRRPSFFVVGRMGKIAATILFLVFVVKGVRYSMDQPSGVTSWMDQLSNITSTMKHWSSGTSTMDQWPGMTSWMEQRSCVASLMQDKTSLAFWMDHWPGVPSLINKQHDMSFWIERGRSFLTVMDPWSGVSFPMDQSPPIEEEPSKFEIYEDEVSLTIGDIVYEKEVLDMDTTSWNVGYLLHLVFFRMATKLILGCYLRSTSPAKVSEGDRRIVEGLSSLRDENSNKDCGDDDSVPSLLSIPLEFDDEVWSTYDLSKYQGIVTAQFIVLLKSRNCSVKGRRVDLMSRLISAHHNELQRKTVVQLRQDLKNRSLKQGGRKHELIQRLVEAGMEPPTESKHRRRI